MSRGHRFHQDCDEFVRWRHYYSNKNNTNTCYRHVASRLKVPSSIIGVIDHRLWKCDRNVMVTKFKVKCKTSWSDLRHLTEVQRAQVVTVPNRWRRLKSCSRPLKYAGLLISLTTDLSLLLQEGFAPPEDEEVDEGAQGEQEEFWIHRLRRPAPPAL